jgi:hypothetical protein
MEYAEHEWPFPELESKLAIKLNLDSLGKSAGLTAAEAAT